MLITLFTISAIADQNCPAMYASTSTNPSFQFTISGDEITDKETALIWQRCSLGKSGSDCSTGTLSRYDWQGALQVAQEYRDQSGQQWRLPNIKELRSIIELNCDNPAVNLAIFQNSGQSLYWSATDYASSTDEAWYVNFNAGESSKQRKSYNMYVRLVRSK
ncbi:MAG: DUF1566 domain-containing protein [Pseudomonadota bacterium]